MRRTLLLGSLGTLFLALAVWIACSPQARTPSPPPPHGSASKEVLRRQLQQLNPKGTFILIDTGANRLYLWRNRRLLLEAVCSTGSGREFQAGSRRWTFRTPRGSFRIRSKTANPVWRKPDWAFLEEGEPVPTEENLRYEKGVLGAYALGIGDGYFIHGTLYERLLGRPITHGCIRLGARDLERLVRQVEVGTPVYIF